MEITERAVSYFSEGDRIAAVVYTAPGGPARKPASVLCHGFTAIKEVILPDYARAFAEAGFVAVSKMWGESRLSMNSYAISTVKLLVSVKSML